LIACDASEAFIHAMIELLHENTVEVWPCSPLIYLVDGMFYKLPIASRIPKRGYKEPHWLPVTVRFA
jgi:hypothetical protein